MLQPLRLAHFGSSHGLAQESYEVWGQFKWGPGGPCPTDLADKTVALKCEGEVYSLPMAAAWLSSRLRSELLAKPGEAVEVPIKKGALVKLVEYLKYHAEHECSEIQIPLAGDNLQDCGASRWDSSFVNVDRELLFDLTVAASYLDIASLWLLLSAKAALLTNNKSSEKLRKEFAMTSDFPAAEEAALRRDYALSRKASGAAPDADLSQLAASSVVRSSVRAAEYKLGLKLTDGKDDSKLKSWRHAMWRAAVLDDWKLMQNAPEEVKSDRDLVRSAILTSQGQALKFISSDLQADEEIVLSAVRHFGSAFADAAPELRNDKNFLLKALGAHGGAMSGASDALRNDKAFLLEAAKAGKGAAMQGVSLALREDRNFVLDMSVHDAEAYKFAAEDLLNDKDFAVAVAKRNGKALKYMLPVFKADPDVVRAAVSRDPQAAQFAHAARRAELGMVQEAIHGEVQLKEELQSQLKAAEEHASTTTTLAVAPTGPRQIPAQALPEKSPFTSMKLSKIVQFSAGSTMTANIGQANYCAANAFLDKIPQFQRPELDGVALMWGAVGGIGMRWKAFASEDFLNTVPDALLTIEECGKVLHCTAVYLFPPEWMCSQKYDDQTRKLYLTPTAGQIKLDVASAAAETQLVDQTALQGLPDVDRRPLPGNFSQAPLGGWPSLVSEGAKVKLTNLRAKNGVTGIVLNSLPDGSGKWKIQLDDGGSVLLRAHFFEVLETSHAVQKGGQHMHNSPQVEAFNAQAEAERQWKIEEKRAKLKEKIAAKRQAILSAAAA